MFKGVILQGFNISMDIILYMSKVHPNGVHSNRREEHSNALVKDLKDTIGMVKVIQLLSLKDLQEAMKRPTYNEDLADIKTIVGHTELDDILQYKNVLLHLFKEFDFCNLRGRMVKSYCEKRRGTRKYLFKGEKLTYAEQIEQSKNICELRDALKYIVSHNDFLPSIKRIHRELDVLKEIKRQILVNKSSVYNDSFGYIFTPKHLDQSETHKDDDRRDVDTNVQNELEQALLSTERAEEAIKDAESLFGNSRQVGTPRGDVIGRTTENTQKGRYELWKARDQLQERGQNLQRVAEKTEDMNTAASEFEKIAKDLKKEQKGRWFGGKTRRHKNTHTQTRRSRHHKK